MSDPRRLLQVIYDGVQKRAGAIGEERPWWPCRKGCSNCCESLGGEPAFTALEWERLEAGLEKLSSSARAQAEARLEALVEALPALEAADDPVACPFLGSDGACEVYADRPATCRSYGYYQCRDIGHFCDKVQRAIVDHAPANVVWGNQDALTRMVEKLGGAPIPLRRWYHQRRR